MTANPIRPTRDRRSSFVHATPASYHAGRAGPRIGRATSGRAAPRRSSSSAPKEDLSGAREWLRAHVHEVFERGRIAASLL
ncbi:hypothetical protein DZF98_00230 [Clavibacter californiensis]|uniref:Uncharacterized protein n=1 Tax=Clavibacter californiensis TaxID=1401995 RepID=A0ABX9NA75_9MICO|nr:hypothetical protein DZF98_00230 [Clavibacter californiensis]